MTITISYVGSPWPKRVHSGLSQAQVNKLITSISEMNDALNDDPSTPHPLIKVED